jgi:hypothetical protein
LPKQDEFDELIY